MSEEKQNTTQETPKDKTPLASIVYECAKEAILIDAPTSIFMYGLFTPFTLPIIAQITAVSAVTYTLSCTMGEVGDQYYGPKGKIIGRAVGNTGKYLSVARVTGDSIKTVAGVMLIGFRGALNGALYGAASAYLPLEENVMSAVPIEMIDSGIGSVTPEALGTGALAGFFLIGAVTVYINGGSDYVDYKVGNATSFVNTITQSWSTVPEMPLPDMFDNAKNASAETFAIGNTKSQAYDTLNLDKYYLALSDSWDMVGVNATFIN